MSKAIFVNGGGYDNLQIAEDDSPELAPDQVRVRWRATSLNYHDLLVAKGLIPVEKDRIPMSDGAGEIIAVGSDVGEWKVGDRVMSLFFPDWQKGRPTRENTRQISGENVDGYIRETSNVSAKAITRVPKHLTFVEAATLPCAAVTAWRGLFVEGGLRQGETVLVEGSGGVSIFALQLAIAAGAKVFATSSSSGKMERLKELGAEAVVNYKEEERWGRSIFKLAGQGVDHVIDVGGGSTFGQSLDAVAIDGHIASIGILDGRSGSITFPKLFFKHVRVTGLAVGSRAMQKDLVSYLELHKITPIIDRTFAFDELGAAFVYQEQAVHFGKIAVAW